MRTPALPPSTGVANAESHAHSLQRVVSPRSNVDAASHRELERGAGAELPKPYFCAGGVTIYHGKMEELVPRLGKFRVAITDAPYGIQDKPLAGNRGATNTWHPPSDWDAEIKPEWCATLCEAAEIIAWFGHWKRRGEVEAAMRHPIRGEIVWAKDTHVGHACPLAMRDERIWLFGASGIKGQRFETSVWDERIIPTWAHKHHKNEKPLNLMLRLVAWLAMPTDTVLDPFMGSGTTLRACKDLGIAAIGIDAEEEHCETAARRMEQECLPGLGGVGEMRSCGSAEKGTNDKLTDGGHKTHE